MRTTQVAIVGAGPSGLLLAQLLSRHGIDAVVLERRSRDYVKARIRAGLLEWTTVELLKEAGVGERLLRDGLVHDGFDVAFANGASPDRPQGTDGQSVLVYGQTELQKDLVQARACEPGSVLWEAADVVAARLGCSAPAGELHPCTARVTSCAAISSPVATATTASAARAFRRRASRVRARVPLRLARACSPTCRRCTRNSCMPITSGASHLCSMRSRGPQPLLRAVRARRRAAAVARQPLLG